MDRALPQNLDTERGLLGILLEENDKLHEVTGIVGKADFFEPANGEIFILLRDMVEGGREAKPATLMHDMAQDADIGGVSASAYLSNLQREAPHGSMAVTFARTIRDLAMRRRLIGVAQTHLEEAFSAPATVSALEIENRYHAAASAVLTRVQEVGLQPMGDVGKALLQSTQKALQGERRLGLSSGLKALDDLWGPLFGGRLYGLSGASGSGKTALAWQIARNIAEATPIINGEPESQVLFESLEMDGEELVTRDLTYLTGIPSAAIESATLSEGEFGRVVDGYEADQRKLPLVIDSAKGQTVGMIRGKAQRLKRLKGLSAIIVDHWRYLKPSSRGDWMETMNEDLRALNAIADDLDVPVILIAQLKASYGSESTDWRKLREPNVGDIFNGAVLEQECDALILVHRMEYMLARRKPTEASQLAGWEEELRKHIGRAQLILNKRRGGGGYGRRTVGFDGPTTRFSDSFKPVDFFSPIQGLSPETSLV